MTKISALSDIGTSVASNDAFVLVDVSDPTTPNKKIQQQNLLAAGGLLPDGSAGTPGLRFTSDTNVGLFRPTTDTLGFATGGSERLRIDSSGRVGIGTSSPINTLHVNGTGGGSFTSGFADALALINATTNTAGQGAALALTALATKETAWIISAEHTSGNNGDLAFYGYPGGASYAERMRITSAGNVGIGTASPASILHCASTGDNNIRVVANGATAQLGVDGGAPFVGTNSGPFNFYSNGNISARIDSSGRLLVGTSSSSDFARLVLQGYSADATGASILAMKRGSAAATLTSAGYDLGVLDFMSSDSGLGARIKAVVDGAWSSTSDCPTRLEFSTTADGASSPTERMRIDSTGRITGSTGGLEISRTVDSAAAVGSFISSSATTGNQYGLYVRLDGDPNNTGQYFLECYGGIDRRATIRSNGGLANYQSNNVDLSDQRTKRNIVPASSSWDCVQALEVVNFNYLDDDAGEAPRVGVIAQQVQQHCPEVVIPYQEAEDAVFDEDGNVVTPAMEERLGVREQQIMWMAIKALQEAQVRIEVLEAEVAALRAQ
jgi:hypothetical protein